MGTLPLFPRLLRQGQRRVRIVLLRELQGCCPETRRPLGLEVLAERADRLHEPGEGVPVITEGQPPGFQIVMALDA